MSASIARASSRPIRIAQQSGRAGGRLQFVHLAREGDPFAEVCFGGFGVLQLQADLGTLRQKEGLIERFSDAGLKRIFDSGERIVDGAGENLSVDVNDPDAAIKAVWYAFQAAVQRRL